MDDALDQLLHGRPGHPLHPPLTDVTIGALALASGLSVAGKAGLDPAKLGPAAWLALVVGLAAALAAATTGFADWLTLEWGSARWRTATLHLSAMLCAVTLYGVAAWLQWPGYRDGAVTTGGLAFAVAGFVALTAGGWLGGAIVFVHGVRVVRETVEEEAAWTGQRSSRGSSPQREARSSSSSG